MLYPAFGIKLSPMVGAAAMSLSSVCVVLNALRLNFFQTDHAAEAAGNDTAETAIAAPAAEISNDEPQTKEADTMEKTLKIEGMMCAHCQKHVHDALAKMDGVTDVTVDLEGGSADVKATRDIPSRESLPTQATSSSADAQSNISKTEPRLIPIEDEARFFVFIETC